MIKTIAMLFLLFNSTMTHSQIVFSTGFRFSSAIIHEVVRHETEQSRALPDISKGDFNPVTSWRQKLQALEMGMQISSEVFPSPICKLAIAADLLSK